MPKIPVRPLIKITKEQYKEIVKRLLGKEAKLTPKAAQELLKYEPLTTREMGTLVKRRQIGPGEYEEAIERLPIEEARARFFASPEEYARPYLVEPSYREIAALPPPTTPLSPEEAVKRIAYERVKFKPIIPSTIEEAMGLIGKEARQEEVESLLKRAGLSLEDIRPGVEPETVLLEKGIKTGVETPPVDLVTRAAQVAAQLWKEMGGARSLEGKRWQQFLEGAKDYKKHFDSGRDYFIASFYRWWTNPKGFSRRNPREAKIFESIRRDPQFENLFRYLETGVE